MANTQAVRKPPTRQLPAPLLPFGSSSPFLLPTSDPCFFHSAPGGHAQPLLPCLHALRIPAPSFLSLQPPSLKPLPQAPCLMPPMLSVTWEGRPDTAPYTSVTALPEQCGESRQAWEKMGGAGCGPVRAVSVLQRLRGPLLSEVPLVDSLRSEGKGPTNRTSHQ